MGQGHTFISAREYKHLLKLFSFCLAVPNDQEVKRKYKLKIQEQLSAGISQKLGISFPGSWDNMLQFRSWI